MSGSIYLQQIVTSVVQLEFTLQDRGGELWDTSIHMLTLCLQMKEYEYCLQHENNKKKFYS